MHIPLLRTFVLGSLIAVLAACSSVDAPTAADEVLKTEALSFFSGSEAGASERPNNNGVCFYSDGNFQGRSLCFVAPNFNFPLGYTEIAPTIRPSWNDRVSSVIVARGYEVVMYTDANFTGRASVLRADRNGFNQASRVLRNDSLSSFKIVKKFD